MSTITEESFIEIENVLDRDKCSVVIDHINSMRQIDNELLCGVTEHIRTATNCNVFLSDTWYKQKYAPGEHMGVHMDGAKKNVCGRRSVWTFLLYLNDNDGQTCFVESAEPLRFRDIDPAVIASVTPRAGNGLLLRQDVLHMSLPSKDFKYILRNDVWIE